MALVGRPEVAFLDEPTSGVDVRGRQVIRQIVRELADDGVAVVLCTHELDEAEKVADRVVIVDRGRVVGSAAWPSCDPPPRERSASRPTPASTWGRWAASSAPTWPSPRRASTVVTGTTDPQLAAKLTGWFADHGHALGDLRAGRQRLEDVFLDLTGDTDLPHQPTGSAGRGGRQRRRRS